MTDFRINVIVDPARAAKGARDVRRELDNVERKASGLNDTVKRAFQFGAVLLAARQLQQLTDAFTNTQNRLKTVVDGERELVKVTAELFDISNRTRSAYEGTAETYARVALATKDLAIGQEQVLRFTESLNQAIILSGASATEAQAGLIQLSQGLASGTLRGDELRSVLEQLPAVADVIARGLGVTRGELRKMGEEGKINAEVVIGAFQEAEAELRERFAKTVPTIGQAFVVLKNNILETVGALDQASGTSSAVSRGIILLANNIDTVSAAALTLGGTVAAISFVPMIAGATASAAAYLKLQLIVAKGNAVILGSALATKLQAAADVEAATAAVARSAASLAAAQTEAARAAVGQVGVLTSTLQAEADLIATTARTALTEATAANVVATQTLAAAQVRLAAATKTTTILFRTMGGVLPFAIIAATATAATVALDKLLEGVADFEEKSLRATEAGEKFALTEFGKAGADVARITANVARLQAEVDRDVAAGGQGSTVAIALLERYRAELARAKDAQALLANGTARTTVQANEQLKALEALADAQQKSIAEIERENMLLGLNSREREIQAQLLKEIDSLEKDGQKLTADQKGELEAALRSNQALRQRAEVLDRIQDPQEQFVNDVKILKSLLAEEAISADQFNAQIREMALGIDGIDFTQTGLAQFGAQVEALDVEGLRALLAELAKPRAPGAGILPGINASGGNQEKISPELELQRDIYREIHGPQVQYHQTQQALNALLAQGKINMDQYAIAMNNATIASNQLGASASTGVAAGLATIENQLRSTSLIIQDGIVNAFFAAEDAFVQFATTGEFEMSRLVDSIIADLARLTFRQAIFAALGLGAPAGPSAAAIQNESFGGYFGGGRAQGGPVSGGTSYLVGEKGPELFTPRGAGQITPAGETAAMMQNAAQQSAPIVNVAPAAVTNLIVNDPNEIPRAMQSPAGEQAVLNIINKNKRTTGRL